MPSDKDKFGPHPFECLPLSNGLCTICGLRSVDSRGDLHVREEGGLEDIHSSLAVSVAKLQSQLEQLRAELAEEKRLRAELKQIAQTGISEVSSVGTVMKEVAVTDLRINIVELCKQRASEYDQYARGYEPSDRMRLCLSAKRDALKAFATELEKL